jgi:hypothetical protein
MSPNMFTFATNIFKVINLIYRIFEKKKFLFLDWPNIGKPSCSVKYP